MTAAALTVGLVAVVAPAQAASNASPTSIFEKKGPAKCATEIRVASQTIGFTVHTTSISQFWDKGYHPNTGASSYTSQKNLAWVQTTVTGATVSEPKLRGPFIASSGYACK